ncbi:hypothetical protein PIB30_064381 [Stylosanthes scabra]|uniref:Uncharacterized protein n=1 Tax=Stylosanthes scabra TaxID=79078 RepID=A0ABU6QMI8_9FABA|nr:hypothetical protein [Stylosanthes scabra]
MCKVNRASSKGGCLHTGGSATIPKTRARMTRSLDRPPTDPELFRETHRWKRDISIVEKRADDLLTEFFVNFEQATQHVQEEGDESVGTVDPNKNRVYGAGGFFSSSLCTSGYGGSSTPATSTHIGPASPEVVDLIDQAEEHMRRMEEMQRQMAVFYNHLRHGSNATVGGLGSSTAPPLPPRPPPQQPNILQLMMMTTTRMRS